MEIEYKECSSLSGLQCALGRYIWDLEHSCAAEILQAPITQLRHECESAVNDWPQPVLFDLKYRIVKLFHKQTSLLMSVGTCRMLVHEHALYACLDLCSFCMCCMAVSAMVI